MVIVHMSVCLPKAAPVRALWDSEYCQAKEATQQLQRNNSAPVLSQDLVRYKGS